jgi:hypothetical protein
MSSNFQVTLRNGFKNALCGCIKKCTGESRVQIICFDYFLVYLRLPAAAAAAEAAYSSSMQQQQQQSTRSL